MAAVIGDDHVLRLQDADHPDGVGFLAKRSVGGAGEDPALEFLEHGLFKAPDAQHGTV